MENTKKYEYITTTLTLEAGETQDSENVQIPDGNIVAMSAIISGNPEARIFNLSVLQNNAEVVRAADVRFSERTSGGTYKDSMRPLNLSGGRTYEARVVATTDSPTEKVVIQVMFMIEN
ncbi:hypothetical protein [Flavobacterium mesophilum]|uniref:hypothetical protein n=1 Tax=Flavobacterium mesophilum TaxID=3143495 RepID=UPI0031E146D9